MLLRASRYAVVALSVLGSAILLFSCEEQTEGGAHHGDEALMTEYSENLSVVMSQNGRRSYRFETPLLEGYTLAHEPYREFRNGVKITTFLDDSMSTVDAVLTANYAIYYQTRELWEAKGNVVARKEADDKTLYTQQLFWNARTGRIYSNVDSKLVQNGGRDIFVGESFESDEEFKDWQFRKNRMQMEVEMPINNSDTLNEAKAASEREERNPIRSAAERPDRESDPRNTRPQRPQRRAPQKPRPVEVTDDADLLDDAARSIELHNEQRRKDAERRKAAMKAKMNDPAAREEAMRRSEMQRSEMPLRTSGLSNKPTDDR